MWFLCKNYGIILTMTKNNDDDACQASKDVICYNSKHAKESTTNTQLLLSSSLQHMLLISYYTFVVHQQISRIQSSKICSKHK